PLFGGAQLLVELDQVLGHRSDRLALAFFLAGDLSVELPPLRRDDRLQLLLLAGEHLQLRLQLGQLVTGWIQLVQEAQHPLLRSALLTLEGLHLEPHVLRFPSRHPAGEQPRLRLLQLGLEQLQLAFRLVGVELQLSNRFPTLGDLRLQGVDPLLGEPVPLQLGQAGTPVQQPIDLEVEFLDVQEIGEGGNLHAVPQASCLYPGRDQGPVPSPVRSTTSTPRPATNSTNAAIPGSSVAACPGSTIARPESMAATARW